MNCSYYENQINRAFTLELQLSKDMKNIISHQFYKSLIKVKNLTYDEFENNMNNDTVYSDSNYLILYNFGKSLRYNIKYDSHIMVENYMIICNTYVAEELKNISSIIRYNKNANRAGVRNKYDSRKFRQINIRIGRQRTC
jgi:exoribonuclease R